ncbi:MAG: alpha-L-fucosidase [Gemmatimonadetes bacterium]|nr:alpha-L-fucosidase [Gemmatimonadota bacterium]
MTRRIPAHAVCLASLVTAALAAPATAQDERPAPENLAARTWFQDAKFGMFIHWGISSLLMDGEWVMEDRRIRAADYERIASSFTPTRFDATAWVALAKAAGMRYVTLITKHHDGFALFDSRVTDWDVMDRTPFRRDIVREMAEACRREGLRLFVYYSQLDWHHPDYWPRGRTGRYTGRADRGDFGRYLDFMDAQLTELFSNYGPLGGVWFDGMWDRPDAEWRLERTYRMIHGLQPGALIVPNHHQTPLPGEDVQTFEKDLPGANTAGWNTTAIGALPLETSQTINDSWGFRLHDRNHKSVSQLVRELVGAAGRNANYLLNIGPMPDGSIQPEFVERLQAVGNWMARFGASIYRTRGGPVPPRPWGVTTQRGDTVYVHVLELTDRQLALPALPGRVRSARVLIGGRTVWFADTPDGVTLTLPPRATDEIDQVIALVIERGTR